MISLRTIMLAHDERICKPLSDEQKRKILNNYADEGFLLIDAVQRELGLIDDKQAYGNEPLQQGKDYD